MSEALLPPAEVTLACGPRQYRLATPSLRDRIAWQREIARLGGRRHGPLGLLGGLRRALEAILAEDAPARPALLEAVDAQRRRWLEAAEAARRHDLDAAADLLAEIDRAAEALAEAEAAARAHWPPYAVLCAEEETWPQIAGVAAAKVLLRGWQGPGLPPFRRDAVDGVPEDLLAAVPQADLIAIGRRAEALCAPSEGQAKN